VRARLARRGRVRMDVGAQVEVRSGRRLR
jgi:hypothetical protein